MPDQSVQNVVDSLADLDSQDSVTVQEIVESIGGRGFGPLLAVPALISISPIGAIPGASAAIAVILALVAGQIVVGRKTPYVPSFLGNRTIKRSRYDKGVEKLKKWAPKIDRYIHKRLDVLTKPVAERLSAAFAVVVALSFLPVILIPGGVVAPSFIILLIGLGLMTRDGYSVLAGWLLGPIWLSLFLWWMW